MGWFLGGWADSRVLQFSSVAQSWPHGLQHGRLPCPSPTPRTCSNLRPLSWWWHPTISSSVVPFSSCLQSYPASGSFPMNQFFASPWPKYWSFSFSISPSSEYSGLISFRIDWFDLLAVRGTLKSLLQHHSSKASILRHLAFFMVSHPSFSHPFHIHLANSHIHPFRLDAFYLIFLTCFP